MGIAVNRGIFFVSNVRWHVQFEEIWNFCSEGKILSKVWNKKKLSTSFRSGWNQHFQEISLVDPHIRQRYPVILSYFFHQSFKGVIRDFRITNIQVLICGVREIFYLIFTLKEIILIPFNAILRLIIIHLQQQQVDLWFPLILWSTWQVCLTSVSVWDSGAEDLLGRHQEPAQRQHCDPPLLIVWLFSAWGQWYGHHLEGVLPLLDDNIRSFVASRPGRPQLWHFSLYWRRHISWPE